MPNDVPSLLSEFYKRPNCQAYAKPAKQIDLLADYLWFRQVLPTLTLEAFLEGYARVADADTQNCKQPAVALATALPRRKPKDQPTFQVFSVEQHLTALTAYTEGLRYLDTVQQPAPFSFYDFIQKPGTQAKLRDGSFLPKKQETVKPKEVVPPPTTDNSRCIYTDQNGREQRGHTVSVDLTKEMAVFEADSGELFLDVPLTKLTVCTDPPPRKNVDENGQPAANTVTKSVKITQAWWARYLDWLGTKSLVGTVDEGKAIQGWAKPISDNLTVAIEILNHVPPVIDARLVLEPETDDGEPVVVVELEPRANVLGEYRFPYKDTLYVFKIHLEG